jgi:hypothetical protein
MAERRPNDIGGEPGGPIARSETKVLYWQAQVDAIRRVLGNDVITLDEMRRGMEELPEETYHGVGFFERRLLGMVAILTEKGIVDSEALERRTRQLMVEGPDG